MEALCLEHLLGLTQPRPQREPVHVIHGYFRLPLHQEFHCCDPPTLQEPDPAQNGVLLP